jgi:hypothetical protein
MRLIAVMVGSLVPCRLLFLLLPQRHQALIVLIRLAVMTNFFFRPAFALTQRLVANQMRATTLAVVMMLASLIGMGVGPQAVGILSDWMMPSLGIDRPASHKFQAAHTATGDGRFGRFARPSNPFSRLVP